MEQQKEYYAFISYKREDEKWAKWLQDKLEHYKFPTNLNGRTDLPKNIRPTFRDVTDLNPGLLAEEIDNALRNSEWLIVVCSPRSAKSPWVCKEAQTFIDLGRADRIIPFVIEGYPFSNDTTTECYPEALLNLTDSKELLAANINEMGRDAAAIKVVARMFNLRFDALWQRHEKELRRKKIIRFSIVSVFVTLIGILLFSVVRYYDQKVVAYCKTGIRPDDGLFNTQHQLLKYQDYAWLLRKETKSLLKQKIYEIDYSYNISPFPVIYSYQSKGGMTEQLVFRHDESQILIGSGIYETSGVLDYEQGEFKHFKHYASSVDYVHNSDTVITCGMGVYKYNKNAEQIKKFEIDDNQYEMKVSPNENHFICRNMNKLTFYNLEDGSIIANQKFDKDIICYTYSKSGKYLAVVTSDSLLSYMYTKTGAIFRQERTKAQIGAITATQNDSSFFVTFCCDSTLISKIAIDSIENETIFTIPSHSHLFHKDVLSYTRGDYLAFTNGRYFVLHNIKTGETFPYDIKNLFKSEMDAVTMSPSGTKVCYAINGKIYVTEIKNKTQQQYFPIQHYGFTYPAGPTAAGIYPNDSTIVMAVRHEKKLSSVGLFNLYSGKRISNSIETIKPIWKVLPLPNYNHAAVALEDINSWGIIDFSSENSIKKLAVDTLTCNCNLMLTANHKYLIGIYSGADKFKYPDCRYIWSATTYSCVDSTYFCSGPLQDGEHLYQDYGIYTYPEGKELYHSTDLSFIGFQENGELFDGYEMACIKYIELILYNFKKRNIRSINLKSFGQGDAMNYKLVGFKNGFALLLNKGHLMIIDTENNELVMQKETTPYECITSATFFNNQSRVLVTTNAGIYIFDILKYEQLCNIWKERLFRKKKRF